MKAFAPLPLRVRARPGEGPGSLLLRLAARGGSSDAREFAQRFGMTVDQAWRGQHDERLAQLSGRSIEAIKEWSVVTVGTHAVRLRGESFESRWEWSPPISRGKKAAYCPQCLTADLADEGAGPVAHRAYWRSWWDVSCVRVCHLHGVALRSGCPTPGCEEPVPATSGSLHVCCGCLADLRAVPTQTVGRIGAFQSYVLGRLGLMERVSELGLDDVPLHHAEALCARLGLAEGRVAGQISVLARSDPLGLQRACDEGMRIVGGGVQEIRKLLDQLVTGYESTTRVSVKRYGPFYNWLQRFPADAAPHISRLREIVRDHALREVPFPPGGLLFGWPTDDSSYVGIETARQVSGGSVKSLRRLAQAVGVLNEDDMRLRRFRRADLSLLADGRDRVLAKTIYTELGLDRPDYRSLIETGRLDGGRIGHRATMGVPQEGYDRFLERIGMGRTPSGDASEGCLSLGSKDVIRIRALNALYDGVITAYGPTEAGVPKSLLIPIAELDRIGARRRKESWSTDVPDPADRPKPYEDLDLLTAAQLAERLGLGVNVVHGILATGLLETVRSDPDRVRSPLYPDLIPIAAVRAYETVWVTTCRMGDLFTGRWGIPMKEAMRREGMTIVELPRSPKKNLLKRAEIVAYRERMQEFYYARVRDRVRRRSKEQKEQHRPVLPPLSS